METKQLTAHTSNGGALHDVSELLHKITDDVKTIASDEVELARNEITRTVRSAAAETAIVVLGGVVALIGFGLLCLVAVAALAPVIAALWLRLLIMAVVYLALGSGLAVAFAKRLSHEARPNLAVPADEARRTIHNIEAGLKS
jgi:hypothetical protein